MKHHTLVKSINIWMSVWVGSFGNERPKSPVSASFGNAKDRSITNDRPEGPCSYGCSFGAKNAFFQLFSMLTVSMNVLRPKTS